MVVAVMALIIWKLWQVTMIMILIYDILIYLSCSERHPKNKRASLGVNVVFFFVCEAIGSSSRHFDGYCLAE